ncbi:MAG: hypothetical protein RJA70_4195 [Pseudomonadota bacterium]|jgi:hypothetical protein
MSAELTVLLGTALTLGVMHTAVGIDHTVPFIVLGRARDWTLARTLVIAAVCGVAHVFSSVAVGAVGFSLGISSLHLEVFETGRGELAAWALIGFGVLYAAYGLWRMSRGDGHKHLHLHADGTVHSHDHAHAYEGGKALHAHGHLALASDLTHRYVRRATVPALRPSGASKNRWGARLFPERLWPALFVMFLLGPCEALVPLMFGAAVLDGAGAWWVALVFGLATVGTMLGLVAVGYLGLSIKNLARIERHANWVAGVAIALSGIAVKLGL